MSYGTIFTDRDKEIAKIRSCLHAPETHPAVIWIWGEPLVGKSTLLEKYQTTAEEFSHITTKIDFDEYLEQPLAVKDCMIEFLERLSRQSNADLSQRLEIFRAGGNLKMTELAARFEQIVQAMFTERNYVFLLLDTFEECPEHKKYLMWIDRLSRAKGSARGRNGDGRVRVKFVIASQKPISEYHERLKRVHVEPWKLSRFSLADVTSHLNACLVSNGLPSPIPTDKAQKFYGRTWGDPYLTDSRALEFVQNNFSITAIKSAEIFADYSRSIFRRMPTRDLKLPVMMCAVPERLGLDLLRRIQSNTSPAASRLVTRAGLPPDLLQELNTTLEKCESFKSYDTLRTRFDDNRIAIWKNELRQADNVKDLVAQTVSLLLDRSNETQKKGLLLLLSVLQAYETGPDRGMEITRIANKLRDFYHPQQSSLTSLNITFDRLVSAQEWLLEQPGVEDYRLPRQIRTALLRELHDYDRDVYRQCHSALAEHYQQSLTMSNDDIHQQTSKTDWQYYCSYFYHKLSALPGETMNQGISEFIQLVENTPIPMARLEDLVRIYDCVCIEHKLADGSIFDEGNLDQADVGEQGRIDDLLFRTNSLYLAYRDLKEDSTAGPAIDDDEELALPNLRLLCRDVLLLNDSNVPETSRRIAFDWYKELTPPGTKDKDLLDQLVSRNETLAAELRAWQQGTEGDEVSTET